MSKNRRKAPKEQKQSTSAPVNIVLPDSLSTEKMQQIITNAILSAEEVKEQKAKEQKAVELAEFRRHIGYKDYSKEKGIKKAVLVSGNRIKMVWKSLFLPRKAIMGDNTTFNLLQSFVVLFFTLARFFAVLFSIGVVIYILLQYTMEAIPVMPIFNNIICGTWALSAFILSRTFRVASIEIQKIEDRNLMFGLFASITSIVSIVIAVIAIVQGG